MTARQDQPPVGPLLLLLLLLLHLLIPVGALPNARGTEPSPAEEEPSPLPAPRRGVEPPNPKHVGQTVKSVAAAAVEDPTDEKQSESDAKLFGELAGIFDGDDDGVLTIEELFDLKEALTALDTSGHGRPGLPPPAVGVGGRGGRGGHGHGWGAAHSRGHGQAANQAMGLPPVPDLARTDGKVASYPRERPADMSEEVFAERWATAMGNGPPPAPPVRTALWRRPRPVVVFLLQVWGAARRWRRRRRD